jgi:hypothetical protein
LASGAAAVAIFLLISFFLPGLSYVSIVMFGFPANLAVLGGYIGWLLLRRVNRSMADICGVAFALALAWVLFVMLPGAPITVLLILLPSCLLYIILKVKSRHNATRLEVTS